MGNETWNLPPPPGFQGLHPETRITFYSRHLPHWRQDGATYFVTFRLADSLPQSKLRELESLKREWFQKCLASRTDCQSVHPSHGTGTDCQSVLQAGAISGDDWDAFARMVMGRVEKWLDQGMGACWLKCRQLSQTVVDALHHFDGEQYELGCYVVMPNHVHVVLRPLCPREHSLERILQGRKRHTSREINGAVGRGGTLWQEESFDRIVRD